MASGSLWLQNERHFGSHGNLAKNARCVFHRRQSRSAHNDRFFHLHDMGSCSLATRSWPSCSFLTRYCNSAPTGGNSFVMVKSPVRLRYVTTRPTKLTCCPTEYMCL